MSISNPPEPLRTIASKLLPYLEDPKVLAIMLNPDGRLWIERTHEGRAETDTVMSPSEAESLLRFVASGTGVALGRDNPTLSGTLPHWNARVHGFLPPAVEHASFTLCKPPPCLTLDECVRQGALTDAQRSVLERAVVDHQNILIGGFTASGKTTVANALLSVMAEQPSNDRIVIVEPETPELRCAAANATFICASPGATGMRTAIQHALAESPDRLVVGDLRDSAASDIVAAWRLPPRRGGLAIVYANGTRGTLEELASLASQSRYPVGRGSVADAVDICVYLVRDNETTAGWRLSALDAVTGYDVERREWLLEPLG